jgi:hypothetical protein
MNGGIGVGARGLYISSAGWKQSGWKNHGDEYPRNCMNHTELHEGFVSENNTHNLYGNGQAGTSDLFRPGKIAPLRLRIKILGPLAFTTRNIGRHNY